MADVAVEDSILLTIKSMLGGLDPSYDSEFDLDIIVNINTSLSTLAQCGIGPEEGYEIKSDEETWEDYLGGDKRLNMVKTFIYHDVRLMFDPPRTSFALNNLQSKRDEELWRLNVWVDPGSSS